MLREIPLRTVEKAWTEQVRNINPDAKTETVTDVAINLTWSSLIASLLTGPRPSGFQISDMRTISKILDSLEAAERSRSGKLLLDDALWSYLANVVTEQIWVRYSPHFIAFTDDILNAPTVNPNVI